MPLDELSRLSVAPDLGVGASVLPVAKNLTFLLIFRSD